VRKGVYTLLDESSLRNDEHDSLAAGDKMEEAAAMEGKSPAEIADFYTAAWLDDEALLNILPADVMPKASDHVAR
jgi:cysteinyl-tRNA synthetase